MDRKPIWLASVLLLAAGCSSPVQQAKDTKYEKLYRDAQDAIEVLENTLSEGEVAFRKQAVQLRQAQLELKRQQEAHESEKAELKLTIERLEGELELARQGKSEATKKPADGKPEDGKPEDPPAANPDK